MARKKLFLSEENLGGLATLIDSTSPSQGNGNQTELDKQIETQTPESQQADLNSIAASGWATLESLGVVLSASLSDVATAMVSSIGKDSNTRADSVEPTLFVQTEEMEPLQDMFFVLQKMHGGLMKGHVNIDDPENEFDNSYATEVTMGYEEFGAIAHDILTITGTSAALEAHYSNAPMASKIKVAVESVEVAKQGIITKAFQVIVKMLKKLLEWLLGPKKTKVETAGKVDNGVISKILKSMGKMVTGRTFTSLTPDDRNDLSKTISNLPMEQQLWFFNGRHVDARLEVASNAAVHKLFNEGSLIGVIHELEDVIETGDDANGECESILKKCDFIAQSKALAAQDANDVGSEVSIHDLRDIGKVYELLDQRSGLIKGMEFAVNSKLDDKLVTYQQKWLKDLETLNEHHAPSKEEHRRRIVRNKQVDVVATFVKMQDKILSDILNFHKAALAIVKWTAVVIESKIKTTDDAADRNSLRQLKKDTATRISELEDMVK